MRCVPGVKLPSEVNEHAVFDPSQVYVELLGSDHLDQRRNTFKTL